MFSHIEYLVKPYGITSTPSAFFSFVMSSLTSSTGLLYEGNIDQVPRTLSTYQSWEELVIILGYILTLDDVHKEDQSIHAVLE